MCRYMCMLPSAQPKANPGARPGVSGIQTSAPTGPLNAQERTWTFSPVTRSQMTISASSPISASASDKYYDAIDLPPLGSLSPSGLTATALTRESWWWRVWFRATSWQLSLSVNPIDLQEVHVRHCWPWWIYSRLNASSVVHNVNAE